MTTARLKAEMWGRLSEVLIGKLRDFPLHSTLSRTPYNRKLREILYIKPCISVSLDIVFHLPSTRYY